MAPQGLGSWVVVVAAGSGRRMGGPVSKQFLEIDGEPLVVHALKNLESWKGLRGTVIVAPSDQIQSMREIVSLAGLRSILRIVPGGVERRDSVRQGLEHLVEAAPDDIVLIHDGVRPFLPVGCLDDLCRAARPDGALLAISCKDTVKREEDGCSVETLDRESLRLAQTPQAFPYARILAAHRWAAETGAAVTDDASLIEKTGGRPRLVAGDPRNLKITTREDLDMAQFLAGARGPAPGFRVGHGYDVHRLVEGRPLILGGVDIPHPKGLLGHSDADVLAHAVTDACLGAAGLGDIGRHFPDKDPQWKGASSLMLLALVREKMEAQGVRVVNVDATVVAEQPKVAPYAAQIAKNLAASLGIDEACVNVKGKTTEGLGFTGNGEGIAAYAVALVVKA